ncbi:LysR family transcriptional regulator [Vibrio salinus]|uniref:LysR family transcriptional regulator n=1 Tax=Vibrio salinus TaxID=2899784 RepID=UPI001E5EC662|nr:LysR family transcriptional regulator [Vibrio salinus]MCE0495620.1 LysR substrate-binding domain-containing protein [Vibrio salinus]
MDIKALRYFVELVDQQSFTRASEKLFVTQPTISKMIRNLEQTFDHQLIHREGRRIWLTDAGEIVYIRAQQILEIMGQLHSEMVDLNKLERGQLRLGIPPMVGHLYAGLIRRYKQLYPNVELTIVECGGRKIQEEVTNGNLDVAITMLTTDNNHCLDNLPLEGYHVHAILPDTKKWQQKESISWLDLIDEPFYMYTEEFTLSDYIPHMCHEAGFKPQISARSSQWDFLVALVKSGIGATFLPEPLCHRIREDGVLVRPITPSIDWQLGVIWHSERYISKTAEAWIQLCREYNQNKK